MFCTVLYITPDEFKNEIDKFSLDLWGGGSINKLMYCMKPSVRISAMKQYDIQNVAELL